jgi:hypothetical protein
MRKSWLVVFAFASVWAAACSSQRAPSRAEHLGSASSELFTNGVPCAASTQCTSGNCIDGVCCSTPCGGGARDLQACSNVYGTIPGLVNGTCKTLVAGDACGSLTTVNPCSWRGTVVNGGNNCPNPPGGSSACFPCATSADCSGGFPICVGGACVSCTGDNGSGATAPCPITTPACTNGLCTQCSATNATACTGAAATCDVATGTCAGCNGDKGSGATRACRSGAAPACLPSGLCVECSATNTSSCTGNAPTCDTASNTCAACNGDNGTAATQACPTSANPYCNLTGGGVGSCGKCATVADCAVGHAGLTCTASGACANVCTTDAMCAPNGFCTDALVCVAKAANGQLLPSAAPVNATCTVANGARACTSGVCDTVDNLCGLPNGSTCGPPPVNAECRSGICSAADNKCGAATGDPCVAQTDCRSLICPPSNKCGNCATDTACGTTTSGKVCDDLAKLCENGCRGTGGNGCAAGLHCTSTDATIGKCVPCLTDANCGSATSGQVCNDVDACQSGCRGSGGNGCAAGETCSSADGTIGTCTGAVPDAGPDSGNPDASSPDAGGPDASGTDAGGPDSGLPGSGCATDSDCGSANSGRICDPVSKTCGNGCRGTGGNGCAPSDVCSSTSTNPGACTPDDGVLEGGGFGCSIPARGAGGGNGTGGGAVVLLLLGASVILRRTRRESRGAAGASR